MSVRIQSESILRAVLLEASPAKTNLLRAIVVSGLLFGSAVSAHSQVRIEQRRPAPASGEVSINSAFGEVTVRGWEKNEVLVKGELASGSEGLDLDSDEEGVDIDVNNPEAWFYASKDDQDFRSRLEVFVPRGSSVWVETVNASVDVSGVVGDVELETVNGPVLLMGPVSSVDVNTMTGEVRIEKAGSAVSVEAISGAVHISGVVGEVEVVTVSGFVDVDGDNLVETEVETVTGDVVIRGSLASHGDLSVETFSGNVTLYLPATIKAEFSLTSFSGTITSALGPKLLAKERFEPYARLSFSTGFDEFEVEVDTHEGNITIETVGGGKNQGGN